MVVPGWEETPTRRNLAFRFVFFHSNQLRSLSRHPRGKTNPKLLMGADVVGQFIPICRGEMDASRLPSRRW